MATNIWRYFTLRMRDYLWHVSIRLANIYSILSSINIYPLLNTVLKMFNVEPFYLETEVAQYEFEMKQSFIYYAITHMYPYPLNIMARIEPNLLLNEITNYRSLIQFSVLHSLRLHFTLIFSQLYNVLQPMILPYNCTNTVLVIACTEKWSRL